MRPGCITCDYCEGPAYPTSGAVIYPHRTDLADKLFYRCTPCNAWVGCHPGTTRPLGRLANAELRAAKSQAHLAFDPMWKGGRMTRRGAYAWLARKLGIDKDKCHIGMFDLDMCNRVIVLMEARHA